MCSSENHMTKLNKLILAAGVAVLLVWKNQLRLQPHLATLVDRLQMDAYALPVKNDDTVTDGTHLESHMTLKPESINQFTIPNKPAVSSISISSMNDNHGTKMIANDEESHTAMKQEAAKQATAPNDTDVETSFQEGVKVIFLNNTDASTMKQHNQDRLNDVNRSPYSIDVLVIGSKYKVNQAQVQRETWASHKAIRNFFLSTEFDDVDPKCRNEDQWYDEDLETYIRECKDGTSWEKLGSLNNYTNVVRHTFVQFEWLKKKTNPTGWLCVQRRFATSFSKLLETYVTPEQLPDYLILADDDTYVNIDTIVKTMIIEPKEHQAKGFDEEQSWYPTQDVPVVTAGCRVRYPDYRGTVTFPFGGYGTFFSNGSLKRLIQPLNCDGTNKAEFEAGFCTKLLQKGKETYPMNGVIGEQHFFQPRDSLNQVLYKYSKNVTSFCLHSDWFIGYITNFYNISRHTPSINQTNWFDPKKENVHESRLHQLKDNNISVDSEVYRFRSGECKQEKPEDCGVGATVCHRMDIESLKRMHRELSSSSN